MFNLHLSFKALSSHHLLDDLVPSQKAYLRNLDRNMSTVVEAHTLEIILCRECSTTDDIYENK